MSFGWIQPGCDQIRSIAEQVSESPPSALRVCAVPHKASQLASLLYVGSQ